MEFLSIYISLLFLIAFSSYSCKDNPILQISQNYIKSLLYTSIIYNENISSTCNETLLYALNNKQDLYLTKLVSDSGKNKNDLGSYQDCLSIDYQTPNDTVVSSLIDNLTYIIIQIGNPQVKGTGVSMDTEQGKYLFGVCVPKGCRENEYKSIFSTVNKYTGMFPNIEDSDINVYDLAKKRFSFQYLLNCIPIVIVFFFMLFSIIKTFPVFFLKPFFLKRGNDVNNKIASCFVLSDNNEEILSNNEGGKNLVTNETGLSFLKGIRGLAIITVILSITFKQLYINPVKIYVQDLFEKLLKSFMFTIVVFGNRFGIHICYCISSFMTTFKLLNYLDNEVETKEEENDLICHNESSNEKYVSLNLDESSFLPNMSQSHNFDNLLNEKNELLPLVQSNIYEKYRHKIKGNILFRFISRQGYKYIMFILSVFYFKFSQYEPFVLVFSPGPVWLYFKDIILDTFEWKHILANIFLYSPFSNTTFSFIDPFSLIYNEIVLFIVCSILVYLSYIKNWRLDIIAINSLLVFELLKFCLFMGLYFIPENPTDRFYPSMIYQETNKGFILSNPFYNIPSCFIGIFFGLINYTIQTGSKNASTKNFVMFPKQIIKFFTYNKVCGFFTSLLSFIIFITSILSFYLGINYYRKNTIDEFFTDYWVNFISLFIVDIGIFFMFLFIIFIFLSGDNFMISFLEHQYWNFVARPYFSFLILINSISYYIFYQIESRVKIEFFNILFYSLLILVLSLFANMISFIFIEIPLKKVNHLLVNDYRQQKKSTQQYQRQ